MDAQKLFLSDGRDAEVVYCGKCGLIYRDLDSAEKCCANYICPGCQKDTGGRSWIYCQECREKAVSQKELERFNKAQKVENWDGPVYDNAGDRYWDSLDDFYDSVYSEYDQFDDIPDYLYCCDTNPVIDLEFGHIVGDIEFPEGLEDYKFEGVEEFQKAIEIFNEANKGAKVYKPDLSQVVLIDKSQIDASDWEFEPKQP